MLNKITFAIRNKKNSKEKELVELGVKKSQIISYNNIDDLMIKDIKTDFVFTLDENCELNENFLILLEELELKNNVVTTSLLNVIDNGNIEFYNKAPLLMNSYDDLINYIDMTTLGIFIPKEILNNENYIVNENLSYYKNLNFYLFLLKNNFEVEIFPKKLLTLETSEFNEKQYSKEELDNEIKQLIGN